MFGSELKGVIIVDVTFFKGQHFTRFNGDVTK